jgi:hypothetical protein
VLLEALPFEEDFDEAEAVYGSLCGLMHNGKFLSQFRSLIPHIFQVRLYVSQGIIEYYTCPLGELCWLCTGRHSDTRNILGPWNAG